MSAIPGVVAINTFREAVRDRVLYNLVFFALLLIGAAILVGQISIGIDRLVIVNLGLSAISVFGLIMAVFIGVGLVYKEIEKRTLYGLLSKPIRRWEFVVGKYAGLLLTLLLNTVFMSFGLAAALFYVGRPFVQSDVSILVAIYLILLEFALVTALALFFSCFSSPMLSILFTLSIYITGTFAADIRELGEISSSPVLKVVTRALYYVVPNFHNFNAIAGAAHGESIPLSLVGADTLYAVLYVALVLFASSIVFSVRDLK
jgi:ABC-type transport system involved in multi-copper enzyme maturation permease subunit